MQAGKLRYRVVIQNRPAAKDSAGQRSAPFANVLGPLWARIQDLDGRELIAAQSIVAEVTVAITLRGFHGWRSAIKPDMRAVGNGRTFDIKAITNPDEKGRELRLLTLEIVG